MKRYHPCQPEVIKPNQMRRGWEGYTYLEHVHPVTGTVGFSAPIFRDRDPLAVVTVSRDGEGRLHVWGDSTWAYPEPERGGEIAVFHLAPWTNVTDISDLFDDAGIDIDHADPEWNGEPA